jgi:hypothetical protein
MISDPTATEVQFKYRSGITTLPIALVYKAEQVENILTHIQVSTFVSGVVMRSRCDEVREGDTLPIDGNFADGGGFTFARDGRMVGLKPPTIGVRDERGFPWSPDDIWRARVAMQIARAINKAWALDLRTRREARSSLYWFRQSQESLADKWVSALKPSAAHPIVLRLGSVAMPLGRVHLRQKELMPW